MLFAADKGDINTIIGGIAPDWGPFGSLGNEAKVMIEVVMAVAIIDRLEGGAANFAARNLPLRSLLTIRDFGIAPPA